MFKNKYIIPLILLCISMSVFNLLSFASEPHTKTYFLNDLSCSYAAAPPFTILYKSVIVGSYYPYETTDIPYEVTIDSNSGVLLYGVDQSCQEQTPQREILSKNYTPTVSITWSQENKWPGGTNRVTVRANASDIDGSITKYEWWIGDANGQNFVKKNSTSSTMIFYTANGGNKTIKVKVTDSGVIEYDSFGVYATHQAINLNTPYHYRSKVETRAGYFEPWSCALGCVI